MATNKISTYTLSWWEKIVYGILFSILYVFSLMPFFLHYIFSDILYYIIYKVIKYRLKIVRKNIKESFPERSIDERLKIERDFYHFLTDYFVETIKLMSISEESIKKHITFHGIEHINDAVAEGSSVSLYLGHNGNWEWVTSIGLHLKGNPFGGQVYHVLENKIFDKLFLYIRQRMRTHCVPMQEILRRRMECKQKGLPMVMGYISDQVPQWHNIHYWTEFLHQETPVLTGAEKITKRFNDHAVYMDMTHIKRGVYRVNIIPMVDGDSKDIPDYELTERYFRLLEQSIQREPAIWLWSHNRWKRTREGYDRWINGGGDDF